MSTPNAQTDPDDLEWLRQIRRKITEDSGHNQKRIGDYLREREKAMGTRVVCTQRRVVPAKP